MNYEDSIGKNIRDVRALKNMSQQAVADKCGFANTILSQYENGKKVPNLITTAKIAKALDVSIDRLYYGDENNAFINSEADDGRKIVNSIYLLWSKGVINYYENYAYGPIGYEEMLGHHDSEKVGVFLYLTEYQTPIKRLILSLNEFKQKEGTYSDPEGYLEMLFNSVAAEINMEMNKDITERIEMPPNAKKK